MAMTVDQRRARQLGKREVFCPLFEKLAERKDLLREGLRPFVFGEQVGEFVPKNGGTARLGGDDGGPRLDFGEQFVHDLEEKALGAIQHADVVERASTAEGGAWNADLEASRFKNFD